MASPYGHHPATTATLLLGLFTAICGAMTPTNGVQFLFPTKGTTLHYNDYVQVQYISEFSDPWLVAFCLSADDHVGVKASQSVGGYNNTATVKLSWSGSDTPCWFDLKPNSTAPTGSGANGDQWSYDVSQRAATTVGLAATSTSTSGATSTPTATSATSATSASGTPSAAATGSSDESGGLSTGAQAGIGAGVAVAGICIGAIAILILRRRRAARRTAAARIEEEHAGGGMSSGTDEVKYPGAYQSVQQRDSSVTELGGGYPAAQELHGASGIHEMPAHAH